MWVDKNVYLQTDTEIVQVNSGLHSEAAPRHKLACIPTLQVVEIDTNAVDVDSGR